MKTNTMPKGWSHYSPTHRITTDKMRPLGKANPDWSFKQSEHIESLKQCLPESFGKRFKAAGKYDRNEPKPWADRALPESPDWRQQLSDAWQALNNVNGETVA